MLKIDTISLFEGTSDEFRKDMEKHLRWKSFKEDEEIINRSDRNSDLFFVQKGKVRVVIYTRSGKEVALDDITEGGFFGEFAAIDKEPRSATVVALEPTTIAFLSADKFEETLRRESVVAMRIMKRMSSIIRHSNNRMVELLTLGANNRIHAEILRLCLKDGIEKGGKFYISPIPVHHEIAARVSTARETVARAMNDLARKHIVSREKRTLVIHDLKALSDIVEDVREDA